MQGLLSGLVVAAVMTAAEKVQQRITGRHDSHVPGRVLHRLTGLPERPPERPRPLNLVMHYGQARWSACSAR